MIAVVRIERRGVGLVLAIVAAIALVALASRGDHSARGAAAALPVGVTDTTRVVALVVLGLVAPAMVALTLWTLAPTRGPRRERAKRSTVSIVAGMAVVLLFAALIAHVRPLDDGGTRGGTGGGSGGSEATGRGDGSSPASRPAWPLGIGGITLLAIAAGAVLHHRRRPAAHEDAPSAIATPEAIDVAVLDAEQCTDPRQSVLLAFAAAEAVLSADPATRRQASTSAREWFDAVAIPSLGAIVGRYEIARFSQHEVTSADRTVALSALRALLPAPAIPRALA